MPRNSSGIYTLPAGNPVTAGTTIDATWANSTLSDLANEITNSLDRYGNGGMLASFRFSDGTVSAPAMSFINETTTGFYRAGTGQMWASVQSTQVAQFTVNGITLPAGKNIAIGGTLTVTGTSAFTGAITATGGVVGNVTGNASGTAANVTGTVAIANGGTGSTTAANARIALLPSYATNALKVLRVNAGGTDVEWATSAAGTVTSVSGAGTVSGLTLTGTVTSSGSLTLGGTLSVTPSNFASQTANTLLAAPNGIAGVPTFRALVAADIPTLNQNTTGTASNVTGTVAVANGGTGATTLTGLVKGNGTTAFTAAVAGTDYVVPGGALGTPSSGTLTNCTFPTLNQNTTGSAATLTTSRTLTVGATGKTFNGSANVSWTLGEIGAAASGANTDITSVATTTTINSNVIGYRDVPQNAQSSAYTFAAGDAGKHVYSTNSGAQTVTVPTNASVALPVGTAVTIVNNGTTAITFTTTGTTVYKAGTSAAWASGGTLAVRGMATWLKVATDTWFVSGSGLS